MCSRPFRPLGLPIHVARGPTAPFTRRYPSRFCLLCRFAQKLHSLDRHVFYVADPIRLHSIPIASRPHCKHLPRMTPGFETRSSPNLLVATLATLPSISLVP